MASEIMPHPCEIRLGPWFNPSNRNLTLKERNVQSYFFNRKADNQTSKRPQFLRLDSTGEAGDSSPEVEEDFPRPHPDSSRDTGCNHHERKKRFNTFTQDFNLKTKKTSKRSSQYLQSNHTPSESKGTEFLEHLATNFNTFSEQATVSNSTVSEMSEFCGRQRMTCYQPMPNSMIPGKRGNPNHHQGQIPNMGQYNPFVNMPFMIPRSSVFHPQSARGWSQPMHHSYMPRVPPPPLQLSHQPWLNCGYPFQGAPRLLLNQTRFSFCPQGAQFTLFSSQQHTSNNNFTRKPNHPPRKTFNNRHSGREKKYSKTFTKILQRPPQSHKEEMSKDCSHNKNISELGVLQNNAERSEGDKESHAKDLGNVDINHKGDENVSSTSYVNVTSQCDGHSEGSKTDNSVNTKEKESKDSLLMVAEDNSKVSRSRHSSIDFLLGGLNLKSSEGLSDSDFADCDWDMLDESSDTNDTWDEHFVSDDPYNPLTGWRCQKKFAVKSEDDRERHEWSCYSQEFDSGTESGSEDESDSDSDDWGGGPDESPSRRTTIGATSENESARTLSQKENVEKVEDQSSQNLTKIASEEKPPSEGNETTVTPADNTAKRKKSLHPSISYILGENGSSSEDFSDDESDDWDSFDDSDDDFAPSLLRREDLNLFQFSNNHFNPLTSFLSCNQGIRPELKNSPSVPCGPIFKPKARTVLISQRIICQVSDSPVSMVVPLEHSGKMSQNSVPTVQCSVVPSREQSFPNSCLRQLSPRTEKTSPKKVHFNNKATLIICPEPSHLVDEIKSTRRGPWLDYARDRCRFQHRIQHLEKMIGPCLSEEHRKKIAESRQLNDSSASS